MFCEGIQDSSKMRLVQTTDTDGTYICIVQILASTITNSEYERAIDNLRKFMRWIKSNQKKYCFIFDMHKVESVPYERIIGISSYLKKKRDILEDYLHSSVIVTPSRLMVCALETAFTVCPPVRPVKIMTHSARAHRESHLTGAQEVNGMPEQVWNACVEYVRNNRNGSA